MSSRRKFRDRWTERHAPNLGKEHFSFPGPRIYWLIMLHAIGIPDERVPATPVSTLVESRRCEDEQDAGNVIDPFVLADKYSAESCSLLFDE